MDSRMSKIKRPKQTNKPLHNNHAVVEGRSALYAVVWWRVDRLLTAPFRFMRARGLTATQNSIASCAVTHLPKTFAHTFDAACKAVLTPPQWDSIEALETDWNIDDSNRTQYLWGQRVYVAMLGLVLLLVVVGMLSLHATSLVVLISSFIVSIATCLVLLLVISISLWRIDVLCSRKAQHYVNWLCQQWTR